MAHNDDDQTKDPADNLDTSNMTDDTTQPDVIPTDEYDEVLLADDAASNEGGLYETSFDEDSGGLEAGTPGHPGIDEDTA